MRSQPTVGPPTHSRPGGDLLPLLPAGAIAAFWVASCLFFGAYFPSAWYPAAIVIVAICPILLAAGWRLPVGGTRLALALLGAFMVWTAASILWADAGGHALEATNKLLLAFATAFVFALTPWTERRALWMLSLFVGGFAVASATTLASAALASNPSGRFISGRFSEPLGYAGAAAAFTALAVWPALALSARRSSPAWLRAAMFAIAAAQLDLTFLPQARGAAIGLALSAPVFVAFAPSRGWAILRLLGAGAILALTVGPVLDVYTAANEGGSVTAALDDAVTAVALAAAGALALGLALNWLEGRRPALVEPSAARRIRAPALVLGVLAVAVGAAAYGGTVSDEVSQRWADFKHGQVSSDSSSHLASFGDPERYDYWRVALKVTGESPLDGIGAGNYQDAYTIHRHDEKHSRYAHSVWLRVLSETGVIGLLLLVGGLLAAVVAVARRRRRLSATSQLLAAGAVAASAYVFLHASVDWIEEFPAILGPALALLFMASRLAEPVPKGRPRRQAATLVAGLLLAGVALVSLVPAYTSLRFVERAESEWPADADTAYTDLDRAAYLNPLSSQPELTRGQIALARGEQARARSAFEEAIGREDNWYPHFELATIASKQGRRDEALAQMRTALRLDSVDTLVRENLTELERGTKLSPSTVDEEIRTETRERFYHLNHPGR